MRVFCVRMTRITGPSITLTMKGNRAIDIYLISGNPSLNLSTRPGLYKSVDR
jgi:hypothetical protein